MPTLHQKTKSAAKWSALDVFMRQGVQFVVTIVWHHATVTRARREAQNRHRGAIVWFTGLSGSGKDRTYE